MSDLLSIQLVAGSTDCEEMKIGKFLVIREALRNIFSDL